MQIQIEYRRFCSYIYIYKKDFLCYIILNNEFYISYDNKYNFMFFFSYFFIFLIFSFVSLHSQITVIASHGMSGTPQIAIDYYKNLAQNTKIKAPRFNDYDKNGLINYDNLNLGGKDDINTLVSETNNINGPLLLTGYSRGAITTINALGSGLIENEVKLIFIESPAAHITDITTLQMQWWGCGWMPGLNKLLTNYYLPYFKIKKLDPYQTQPIHVAHNIDKNIPIIILASKKDTIIPASSSARLAKAFVDNGHKNVRLIITEEGSHVDIKEKNIELLNAIEQAIRKELKLPFDKELAHQGSTILNKSILTKEKAHKIYNDLFWHDWKQYSFRNLSTFSLFVLSNYLLMKKRLYAY